MSWRQAYRGTSMDLSDRLQELGVGQTVTLYLKWKGQTEEDQVVQYGGRREDEIRGEIVAQKTELGTPYHTVRNSKTQEIMTARDVEFLNGARGLVYNRHDDPQYEMASLSSWELQ